MNVRTEAVNGGSSDEQGPNPAEGLTG